MEATKHTVLDSEIEAFTNHVNYVLAFDYDVISRLPIAYSDIFNSMHDGIIFCKLINYAANLKVPPIAPQAINLHPANMYQKIENINLAIESARSIGCIVVNIRPQFIIQKRQHIIMGLIWQIIRIHLQNQITIKEYPQIILLLKQGQSPQQLFRLGYEEILLRWLNYHIKKNGDVREIKNFTKDMTDSYAYGNVLQNISGHFQKSFWYLDDEQRAKKVIQICQKEDIRCKVSPRDILNGNLKLNQLLCASIFNKNHGLVLTKPVELPNEPQTDETRQMRVFKNWINSQGIDDVYVNYLIQDLKDGRILLKVLDKWKFGLVQWNKYSDKLYSRIHIVQNCNYVVDLARDKLGAKIIGIGGVDIVDGKTTLVLGVVWQIYSLYWRQRIGNISDEKLIQWANERVPYQHRIKSFKDKSIANCMFLLHLINSMQPKMIDFERVQQMVGEEKQILRINYTISAARKLGAQIVTLWQHIKESNGKFIWLFVAELHRLSKEYKAR